MEAASADTVTFDAIRVPSAPEALAQAIRDRIRSGSLLPGTRLPAQRELARGFQVGLGSVREAVKILHVMGYLEVVPGKGTFISRDARHPAVGRSPLDEAMEAVSLSELMRAREIVECGAARLAAERLDEESLRRLGALARRLRAGRCSAETYYRNDFEFHIAVAEASDNPAVTEMVKLLVERTHRHIGFMSESLCIAMPANAERCVRTARRVVFFIESGDGAGSEAAMREHLNIVRFELDKGFPGCPNPEKKR